MTRFAIINTSKAIPVADDARLAATSWERMKGLLGRSYLAEREALVIPHCASIHTCFMRFSIDVLFVNKQLKVIRAIHGLKPFRLTMPIPGAWGVIELASGVVSRSNTVAGDQLGFGS